MEYCPNHDDYCMVSELTDKVKDLLFERERLLKERNIEIKCNAQLRDMLADAENIINELVESENINYEGVWITCEGGYFNGFFINRAILMAKEYQKEWRYEEEL